MVRNRKPMDQVSALNVFVQVAQTRSFVAAGRALGVSASATGKTIARLEAKVGVRLLHRSTRSVALTPEGSLYLERARRILNELEMADAELSQTMARPKGMLRVSMPLAGELFTDALIGFRRAYPEVDLDIDHTNRQVDLINEGIDLVVRSGDVTDSGLMQRRLGDFRMRIVGSPAYFEKNEAPASPLDLAGHPCLHLRMPLSGKLQTWRFRNHPDDSLQLPVAMICNDTQTRVAFAVAGLGLAYVPDFAIRRALDEGRLVSVLDEHVVGGGTFRALWPPGRQLTPKVRAFLDFLKDNLLPAPGTEFPASS
jgi:DNA-binding transcriptional LysR family regulator